jgi:hypothetical protein
VTFLYGPGPADPYHLLPYPKIRYIYISLNNESYKEDTELLKLKSWFFVVFLLVGGRIRILEAQKLTGPTDPDPEPEHR